MMFKIEYNSQSRKFLKNLEKHLVKRILEKLEDVSKNPFRYLEHHEGRDYKLRIGDYRALVDVDFKSKILIVRILDKRGRIYKK
ncbi:MAG: type II toxin-antitoxin system RelE/ParE family toxin [Nanoarchaeota archaeon]|nr:type II toxin-antitoxin system RelE/ParE family toxin [Nanoarchaeota archaeon]